MSQVECCLCFLAGIFPREPALSDGPSSHGFFPAHLYWHRISVQSGGFSTQVTGTGVQRWLCLSVIRGCPHTLGWRVTVSRLCEVSARNALFPPDLSLPHLSCSIFQLLCTQFALQKAYPWWWVVGFSACPHPPHRLHASVKDKTMLRNLFNVWKVKRQV